MGDCYATVCSIASYAEAPVSLSGGRMAGGGRTAQQKRPFLQQLWRGAEPGGARAKGGTAAPGWAAGLIENLSSFPAPSW